MLKNEKQYFEGGLSSSQNSLGIVRLTLSILVIFSHSFYLGGWGVDPLLAVFQGQDSVGGVAVLAFFAISGFLITQSGLRVGPIQFIWRRFLRIFPAYWAVLIITAFIVGPVVWVTSGRQLSDFFVQSPQGPFAYVLGNLDLNQRQWGIFDIYASTPWGAVFNGSLWTLAYEWGAYLIVFGLILFGVMQKARILIPILTAFYFLAELSHQIVPGSAAQIIPYFADHFRVNLTLIFLFGACLAVYAKFVVVDWRIGILSIATVSTSLLYGGWTIVGYPALAYFVLWFSLALPKTFQWIGQKNDYSYGTYIYGFLVQQTTAYLGWHNWGYIPWTLASTAITLCCAWLSWHLIEKRAMALKGIGPGRGSGYWVNKLKNLQINSTFFVDYKKSGRKSRNSK
jgi:peptidoglycan/LPS O-acetylase OafA/YrhL